MECLHKTKYLEKVVAIRKRHPLVLPTPTLLKESTQLTLISRLFGLRMPSKPSSPDICHESNIPNLTGI